MSEHPLVSFVVLAYRQERFIREAVRSALEQTYEPMEILLSDDCSPDHTFEIMQEEAEAYRGPHRVVLNRNTANIGLAAHMNRGFELTSGDFVVVQAGDDISMPQRTAELTRAWLGSEPRADLICSHHMEIDVEGVPNGKVVRDVVYPGHLGESIRVGSCIALGATAAYSRKLYKKFGPLDTRVLMEDWIFPFRALLETRILVVDRPLLKYRVHGGSFAGTHLRGGQKQSRQSQRAKAGKIALSKLAIVEDWLRCWDLNGRKDDELRQRLVAWCKYRELDYQGYCSRGVSAVQVPIRALVDGLGVLSAARLFKRHVLGWI